VHVDDDEAVCCWRYADSEKNPLKVFVKSCASILEDWKLISSANAERIHPPRSNFENKQDASGGLDDAPC
jgi:hypothetical protein